MNQIKNLMPSVALLIFALSTQIGNLKGASAVFIIDPTQSQVTLSGTLDAFGELSAPITAQGPGSLTASYAGTIDAEVNETTIQFTGSSLIEAQTNASPQQPAVGGAPGSDPADYGGTAEEQIFFTTISVETALRNVALDLTSPMLTLTSGTFASTSLEFLFSSNVDGTIDYDSPSLGESGTAPLTGDSTDTSSTPASLTTTGNVQVLSIPVNMTFTDTSGALEGTTLNMVGQIVATQTLLPPLIINSITVTNQMVVLIVANATTQSEVLTSTDLKTWSTQPASVTSLSDQIIFTFPLSEGAGFFRVKQ
jgi:hypothetical protein